MQPHPALPLLLLVACGTGAAPKTPWQPPADTGGGDTAGADPDGDPSTLVLNEFMAYDDDAGWAQGADWIELYNSGSAALDLSRFALWSDDDGEAFPWMFPAGTTLAAGSYFMVICDGTNQAGEVPHASFAIERHGGTLKLYHDGGKQEEVPYEYQLTGLSTARTGGAEWASGVTPTPGASNGD